LTGRGSISPTLIGGKKGSKVETGNCKNLQGKGQMYLLPQVKGKGENMVTVGKKVLKNKVRLAN